MTDLIVLVPDKPSEFVVRGALARHKALGIRGVTMSVVVDPARDGGVRSRGADILRLYRRSHSHALMIFDHEGSGASTSPIVLERELDAVLAPMWGADAKAIAIAPEIDIWMWGADSHLKAVCGWQRQDGVREWLRARGFSFNADGKPQRPKEALQAILRESGIAQSAALYQKIAARVTLSRCTDPAFLRVRERLVTWFAAGG